ncbi:MAG: hypothetical protein LC800_19580 [Acidobacteria bacterium]|nr:hypothetical protein [Acidobacteriota bacterium]
MKQSYAPPEDELKGEMYRRIYLLLSKRGGGWRAAGAAFGLACGLLSVPVGLLAWAAAGFIGPVGIGPTLGLLSNIIFAVTLPLLAVGAFCLDLLEETPPRLPLPAESRRAGLKSWRHLRPGSPLDN